MLHSRLVLLLFICLEELSCSQNLHFMVSALFLAGQHVQQRNQCGLNLGKAKPKGCQQHWHPWLQVLKHGLLMIIPQQV